MARSPPEPGSLASVERHRGPRHRDRQILRGRGAGIRRAHQQLRGRLGGHSSGAARVWQHPWLRRRLSHHLAHLELRGPGRHRRGYAARLLVHQFTRLARTAGRRRPSAAKARAAPSRGWDRARSPRAARRCCSCRNWRAASSAISSPRFAAAASTGKSSFLLEFGGSAGVSGGVLRLPSGRTSRRPWAARRSTTKALQPAIASWSPTASSPATFFPATRRANSACKPPATPAARTISSSRRRSSGGLEAMLPRLGTGLLLTELMGQGVNTVTGDYSRGAAGFWVENGAIQYPGGGDHHRRQSARDVRRSGGRGR